MEKLGLLHHQTFFSNSYTEARDKFISASECVGAEHTEFALHNQKGPNEENLYMDVSRIGAKNPKSILLISSGVHGVEGFCGSACQTAILSSDLVNSLGNDTAIVMIHAINPFGFAHLRRWNEDNIDINRNFMNFADELPLNRNYRNVHQFLLPEAWNPEDSHETDEDIINLIKQVGYEEFISQVVLGQYSHPDGLFYGGETASWSAQTFQKITHSHLSKCEKLIFIDIHTGLGEIGKGTFLYMSGLKSERFSQSVNIFGDELIDSESGEMPGAYACGEIVNAFSEFDSKLELLVPVTLEFGTFPISQLLDVLRFEQLIHSNSSNRESQEYKQVKQLIKDAYYCDNAMWKRMVIKKTLMCIEKSVAALLNHQ